MDTNNWRPPRGGGEPAMVVDTGGWRSQLVSHSRQRIVNKIMDTLKRCLPVTSQEAWHELMKIAVRFEERIYTCATSQSDYLRKISLKMLTMENKYPNTITNSLQTNSAGNSNRPPESESETMDTSGADWQEEVYQKVQQSQPFLSPTQHLTIQMQYLSLQQQSHPLLQDMQQRLQQLYTMRQNQSYQSQGALLEKSSNFVAQTGHADWQEEAYKKIKVMKQLYFPKLSDMYWKAVIKLQKEDSYVQQLTPDQHANLNMLKNILERIISVLHFSKADISVGFMETLVSLEQHILTLQSLLNTINPDIV